jgi:hypothetical protein
LLTTPPHTDQRPGPDRAAPSYRVAATTRPSKKER